MSGPRMFEPGDCVESIGELLHLLHLGRYVYVFKNGKPSHPAVVRNLSLAQLERAIQDRTVRQASVRAEWVVWAENRKPRLCDECGNYPAEVGWKICAGCHAYRDHTGQG